MSASSRRVVLIAITTLSLALAAFIFIGGALKPGVPAQAVAGDGLRPLIVKGETLYVSIADTEAERARGLGGRDALAPNHGMLFIFPEEGQYGFWMKDMRFSVDILWIGNDGTIVHIEERVAPDTYPHMFASEVPARYVLEVNAEYVSVHGLTVGEKLTI